MTLTIKLDRNWSSFQLANSAPPLSVTDSAIAPSARMCAGAGPRLACYVVPPLCWFAWDTQNKEAVVCLPPSSGHCMAFSSTIPPLQVALSFACSVASLSLSPSFQLPGWHSLHRGSLADYLLGWGRTSTCTTGHTELQHTPTPRTPDGLQEFPP